eukprot:9488139-Pyramimonas_sp.AAC.1
MCLYWVGRAPRLRPCSWLAGSAAARAELPVSCAHLYICTLLNCSMANVDAAGDGAATAAGKEERRRA